MGGNVGRYSRVEGPVSQDGALSQATKSQCAVVESPSQASRKVRARKTCQVLALTQSPVMSWPLMLVSLLGDFALLLA